MSEFTFDAANENEVLSAPQAPGTNALVQNPFAFEAVAGSEPLSAPQAPGTHALVQNPFAWND